MLLKNGALLLGCVINAEGLITSFDWLFYIMIFILYFHGPLQAKWP